MFCSSPTGQAATSNSCCHLGASFDSLEPPLQTDDALPLEVDDREWFRSASLAAVRVAPLNRSWLCLWCAARFCLRTAARSKAEASNRPEPVCSWLVSGSSLSGWSVVDSTLTTMATLAGALSGEPEVTLLEVTAESVPGVRFLSASADRSCAHVLAKRAATLPPRLSGVSWPPDAAVLSAALPGTARSR